MLEKRKPIKKKGFKVFVPLRIKASTAIAFFLGISAGAIFSPLFHTTYPISPQVEAYFSPSGSCTEKIIRTVDSSISSIYVMAYSFTALPIARALLRAHERGIDVKILIDRSQLKAKYSQCHFLLEKGVPIFIDSAAGIAHNKVMIIDGKYILTGSFNFTQAAETKNAENLLFIRDTSLANRYKQNWEKRVKGAKQLRGAI